MKKHKTMNIQSLATAAFLILGTALPGLSAPNSEHTGASSVIGFEDNVGQFSSEAQYRSRGLRHTTFLTKRGPAIVVQNPRKSLGAAIHIELDGASDSIQAAPGVVRENIFNYFARGDHGPATRRASLAESVRYAGAYPGIDVVYRFADGVLEYDFHVAPGARADAILLNVRGVDGLDLSSDGSLVMRAGGMELRQGSPVAFQDIAGERRFVEAEFILKADNSVAFRLGDYDPDAELVIDPTIDFSTYLGEGDEEIGNGIVINEDGTVITAGRTDSSDFRTTAGSFETTFGGDQSDAFVTKFNTDGTLAWSTFYGSESTDYANGIALGSDGAVYITGQTESEFLPVTGFDTGFSGEIDCFVAKLSADGAALAYATYLGDGDEDICNAIKVNDAGEAFVTGYTISRDFPSTDGAYQSSNGGGRDAFVAKISGDGLELNFSTFLGGSSDDTGYDLALHEDGYIFVVGDTQSGNFPVTDDAAENRGVARDAFLSVLSPDGQSLVYSTYLGGSSDEFADAVDYRDGLLVVVGETSSSNFPLMNAIQSGRGDSDEEDVFVSIFRDMGREMVFSTFLGGDRRDFARDVEIDSTGRIWITGGTSSDDFPQSSAPLGGPERRGDRDVFMTQLAPVGGAILYSAYYGGDRYDEGTGVAIAADGSPVFSGFTRSSDFPLLRAFQSDYNGGGFGEIFPAEAFVAKLLQDSDENAFTVVSSATFVSGPIASGAIVSGFGEGLADSSASAESVPLPTELAGARVRIVQPNGSSALAGLVFVSPGQINFILPDLTSLLNQSVDVEVLRDGEVVARGAFRVARSAPGLYTADQSGGGVAAAYAVQGTDAERSLVYSTDASGAIEAAPIDLSVGETVLELYGTGISGAATVTATVNGEPAEVLFSGPAPGFEGLDQINIPLDAALAGAGEIEIVITTDGAVSNVVTVVVQ